MRIMVIGAFEGNSALVAKLHQQEITRTYLVEDVASARGFLNNGYPFEKIYVPHGAAYERMVNELGRELENRKFSGLLVLVVLDEADQATTFETEMELGSRGLQTSAVLLQDLLK